MRHRIWGVGKLFFWEECGEEEGAGEGVGIGVNTRGSGSEQDRRGTGKGRRRPHSSFGGSWRPVRIEGTTEGGRRRGDRSPGKVV